MIGAQHTKPLLPTIGWQGAFCLAGVFLFGVDSVNLVVQFFKLVHNFTERGVDLPQRLPFVDGWSLSLGSGDVQAVVVLSQLCCIAQEFSRHAKMDSPEAP